MNFKDFERKAKIENMKRSIHDGLEKAATVVSEAGKFAWDHRLELSAMALGAAGIARTANKIANDSADRKRQDRMTYDGRAHEWYESRRKLTSTDKLKIDELYRSGMNKGEALRMMGLLK